MTSEDSQRRSKYFPGTFVFDVFRQNNVVASTSISEKIEESKAATLFNIWNKRFLLVLVYFFSNMSH